MLANVCKQVAKTVDVDDFTFDAAVLARDFGQCQFDEIAQRFTQGHRRNTYGKMSRSRRENVPAVKCRAGSFQMVGRIREMHDMSRLDIFPCQA